MGSSKEDSANGADNSAANRRRADSNSKLFSDGEKVLAYHGPRIYEAKACELFSTSLTRLLSISHSHSFILIFSHILFIIDIVIKQLEQTEVTRTQLLVRFIENQNT